MFDKRISTEIPYIGQAVSIDDTVIEMVKFRGGDNVSMRYLDDEIIKTGGASMAGVPGQAERPAKSVRTLSSILTAMMFTNNFAG